MKPATEKAHALRAKLQALAERGVNGEKLNALAKLRRLEKRYDFTAKILRTEDIFSGTFPRSSHASPLCRFPADESDIASSVKWAIEHATGLGASFRGISGECELWVEAAPACLARLETIARNVALGFRGLWNEFQRAPGANPADRGCFVMGLYDGMMNEARTAGQPLPQRTARKPKKLKLEDGEFPNGFPEELQHFAHFNRAVEKKPDQENGRITWIRYYYNGKLIAQSAPDLNQSKLRAAFYKIQAKAARAMTNAPGLSAHPYTVAVDLGRKLRFSATVETLTAELQTKLQKQIA